ncbi:hypothetical protein ABC347_01260 [Sphingomonas sp. 1P06PA]
MNHWAFVIAAYALALGGTAGIVGWCYAAMRRAERRADEIGRR